MEQFILFTVIGIGFLAAVWWIWPKPRMNSEEVARSFVENRESLQKQFLSAAVRTGKPKGLVWLDVTLQEGIRITWEPKKRLVVVFADATIRFEPVAGSDMEQNPMAREPRSAVAVLYYRQGIWTTDGRALFNVNSEQATNLLAGGREEGI